MGCSCWTNLPSLVREGCCHAYTMPCGRERILAIFLVAHGFSALGELPPPPPGLQVSHCSRTSRHGCKCGPAGVPLLAVCAAMNHIPSFTVTLFFLPRPGPAPPPPRTGVTGGYTHPHLSRGRLLSEGNRKKGPLFTAAPHSWPKGD